MASLIDDLIEETTKNSDLSSLLRKARVVSNGLKISDFESWIVNELNGYEGQNIPEYRKIHGSLKFHNPVHGWCPILFPNDDMDRICSTQYVGQKIAEIEALCKADGIFAIQTSPNQKKMLGSNFERYEVKLLVEKASLHGILDSVRNTLQDWVLKLKDKGVNSQGITFTVEEQKVAKEVSSTVINNTFHGPVANAAIQQATSNSQQITTFSSLEIEKIRQLVEDISKDLKDSRLASEDTNSIKDELSVLSATLKASKPNNGVIKESLKSLRNILEGVMATKLAEYIPTINVLLGV